jgi:hypothetical protein
MGRRAAEYLPLPDGTMLGIGFKDRGGVLRCRFVGPDGKPVELSTGVYTPAKWKPGRPAPVEAIQAAAQHVVKVYAPTMPPDPRKVTWEKVVETLPAAGELRPKSLVVYLSIVNVFRKHVPTSKGPADVTVEVARKFRTDYASTPFTRSGSPKGPKYKRSPKTVENAVRRLTGLWNKLIAMGYATANPWLTVPRPTVPKVPVKVPDESTVAAFMRWVRDRYPGWELPVLFCEVKALIGCRTMDLCSVRSDQLEGGRLTIEAGQDKTHRQRTAPLPADLSHKLDAVKGPTYLWESYTRDARTHRRGPRNRKEFHPKTLYAFVAALFRDWNAANPHRRLKPHDLRKRAITLTAAATQSIDQTAEAIGIDPGTARRYYLDAKRAIDGQALLAKMADVLRPK